MKLPASKNTLAEPSLSKTQVLRMLALEPNHRNRVLVRLLYVDGLRVWDIVGPRWRDRQVRDEAGQVMSSVRARRGLYNCQSRSGATW